MSNTSPRPIDSPIAPSSSKIEAAIFDIGNVLLLFDYMKAATRLAEKNGMKVLPDRTRITAALHKVELGQSTRAQFLSVVRPEFHDDGDENEFIEIWENIFEENLRMTALARTLSLTMPIFLVSNIGEIHHHFIFRKYEIFSRFRDGIYSYEVGLMKPDPAMFELAKSRFDVNPAKTLYFDDMKENCEAAIAAGFIGCHYEHDRHDLPGAWGVPLLEAS